MRFPTVYRDILADISDGEYGSEMYIIEKGTIMKDENIWEKELY